MTRLKNKINTIYERPSSLSRIIMKPETSGEDLETLARRLNIPIRVTWKDDYDPKFQGGQVLNMGNESIGGTHWVATYRDKYFDPFGMPPPPKLIHLQWMPLDIQDQDFGHCGQYSVYWIYFAMKDELDQFYSLFTPENIR